MKRRAVGKDHNGNDLFTMERVLDMKIEDGKTFYLIEWAGYELDGSTWEPASGILKDDASQKVIQDFLESCNKDAAAHPSPSQPIIQPIIQPIQPAAARPSSPSTSESSAAGSIVADVVSDVLSQSSVAGSIVADVLSDVAKGTPDYIYLYV